MENIKVDFKLHCWARKDTETNILVGYIPTLRVYSQGRTDTELESALASAAEMFIVTCYRRGIFSNVLIERGMTVAPHVSKVLSAAAGSEYIKVSQTVGSGYDRDFTINVPIELIAAQQAGIECHQQ